MKTLVLILSAAALLAENCDVLAAPAPLLEFKFDQAGIDSGHLAKDTGLVGRDQLLTVDNSTWAPGDARTVGGLGVSGLPTDRALDSTSASFTGQADGGAGVVMYPISSRAPEIDGLVSFTLCGWYKTVDTALGGSARLFRMPPAIDAEEVGSFGVQLQGVGVDPEIYTFGTTPTNVNQWVFWAITYDGTQTESNAVAYVGFVDSPVTVLGTVSVGQGILTSAAQSYGGWNLARGIKGYLDNLRVFGNKTNSSGILGRNDLENIRLGDLLGNPSILKIDRAGTNVVVSWQVPATLQSADQLIGPWNNLNTATSPHVVPVFSAPRKFYRLTNGFEQQSSAPLSILPIFNVMNFGAKGDGGTDDTTAIQNAINAARDNKGGIVYFPSSTNAAHNFYRINSPITIPATGIYLEGDGPNDGNGIAIGFASGDAIRFGGQANPIYDVGIRRLKIASAVTRTSGAHVWFNNMARGSLTEVTISGALIGVQVGSTAWQTYDITLTRCRINNDPAPTGTIGVWAYDYAALWINNCVFNGSPGKDGWGVLANGPQGFDGLYLNDTVIDKHDTGIMLSSTAGSVANVKMVGGAVTDARNFAIRASATNGAVNGVQIIGPAFFGAPDAPASSAILFEEAGGYECQRLIVADCFSTDFKQRFVQCMGKVDRLTITGNTSVNSGSGAYPGIDLLANSDSPAKHANQVVISGNNISGQHNRGVRLSSGSTNIVVVGNTLTDNTVNGVLDNAVAGPTRIIADNNQ